MVTQKGISGSAFCLEVRPLLLSSAFVPFLRAPQSESQSLYRRCVGGNILMMRFTLGLLWVISFSLLRQGETIHDDSLPGIFLTLDLMQKEGVAIDTRRAVRHTRRLQDSKTLALNSSEILPLFQGMGTHYSYIYVGT